MAFWIHSPSTGIRTSLVLPWFQFSLPFFDMNTPIIGMVHQATRWGNPRVPSGVCWNEIPWVKLDSYQNTSCSHHWALNYWQSFSTHTPHSTQLLSYKMHIAERLQTTIESCIMSVICSWSWAFSQLVEQRHSWRSVFLMIY